MIKFITILFCLFPFISVAQLNLQQSSSSINWHEISSEHFKIVFPGYLEERAQYTLKLLDYYRPIVGKIYHSRPKKITISIRPDMSLPNGFVALAPRRSDWFNYKSINPFVGSLEWYQQLAIHEYRHIVQYDHLKKGRTKWFYYLFGEQAQQVVQKIVMPRWYFEGDAVWAETTLSNAGRGRSPRFAARFKALLMSDQLPFYDDLLAGDYETSNPDLYVYGYFLIARGIQKFGPDFWVTLSEYSSDRPWNLFTFANSFFVLTGEEFDNFYYETLLDLKSKWDIPDKSFLVTKNEKYSNTYFPTKTEYGFYSIKKEFNEYLALYKDNKRIKDLRIYPSLSSIDIKHDILVFAQDQIHQRYSFKNNTDLYYYDIHREKLERITKDKKYFHPKLYKTSKKILAVNIDKKDKFSLHILNLSGDVLESYSLPNGLTFAQADWIDESSIVALIINPDGTKQIATYKFDTKSLRVLTPPTLNNLFNISHEESHIYFEADYQGKVNVFQISLSKDRNILSQCSDEYISATMPSVYKNTLSYVWESAQGKRKKSIDLNCTVLKAANLFQVENYISNSPSDNYHKAAPVKINNYKNFLNGKKQKTKHKETSQLFTPHSWSFIGGRGFELSVKAQNELGDMAIQGATGIISGEGTPFVSAYFDYMKYYPIISTAIDHAGRHLKVGEISSTWNETKLSTKMTLPYLFQQNYFNGGYFLTLGKGLISVTENDYIFANKLNDDDLHTTSIGVRTFLKKEKTIQGILSPWSYSFNLNYINLESKENTQDHYLGQANLGITTPGFVKNHGMALNYSAELRPNNETLYQLQTSYSPVIGGFFSRGYQKVFTSKFDKISYDYAFPIMYPKVGLSDWFYLNRVYAKVFFDTTKIKTLSLQDRTLNSKGIEIYFDTKLARLLPFSYGLRFLHKEQDDQVHIEFFLASFLFN